MADLINKIKKTTETEEASPLLNEKREFDCFPTDPLMIHSTALPMIEQAALQTSSNRSIICQVLDVEGDSFYLAQNVTNLWDAVYGQPTDSNVNSLAFLSIYSIYTGYTRGSQGVKDYIESKNIGDATGQVLGVLSGIRGPIEIVRGCSNVCTGVLSSVATYSAFKGTVAASIILKGMSYGFSGVIYLLLGIPSLITLVKNVQFGRKWHRGMDQEKETIGKTWIGLKTLIEELQGSKEEKEGFLKKIVEKREIWDEKGTKVLDPTSIDSSAPFDQKERAFLVKEAEKYTSNPECARRLYGHFYQAYSNFKAKKEADFIRKTGLRSLEAVRNYLNEVFPVEAEDAKLIQKGQEVIDCVKSEMTKNKVLHFAIFFFCSLGIGLLIASGLGVAGLAMSLSWIFLSLGMFAIDWHFLSEKLQLDTRDRRDEKRLFIANAFLMLMVGAGVCLGGGLAPFIIESLWFSGFALYSMYRLKTKKDGDVSLIFSEERHLKTEEDSPLLLKTICEQT